MKIRLVCEKDIDYIVKIEQDCFADDSWSRRQFEEELENPLAIFVAAWDDSCEVNISEFGEDGMFGNFAFSGEEKEKIIAYALGLCVPGVVGEIASIATLPQYRNKGIAESLLDYMISECKEKHVPVVQLEARASNFPAIGLYKKIGFKEDAVRRNYYQDGEDAILMSLELSDGN